MAIKMVIDIMERVLVMSSQEVGQAASHELREKEVMNIASATTTRLEFTSSAVDDAREAWKEQLYKGLMAYGDPEFYAQIPFDPEITPKLLKKLGFTYDEDKHPKSATDRSVTVKVNKTAIALFTFAASNDWLERNNDLAIAQAMAQALGTWLANPMLANAIGPEQALQMINMICRMAGFPKEFKLENKSQENEEEIQKQLQMVTEIVKKQLLPDIQGAMKNMMDIDRQQDEAIKMQQAEMAQMKELLAQLAAPPEVAPPSPMQYDQSIPQPAPPIPIGSGDMGVPEMAPISPV